MPLTCRQFTAMLADAAQLAQLPSGDDGLADHARTCATCAGYAARLERNVAALRALAPLSAPAALEGRAVAAFEAGHRSERAATFLRTLGRRAAPASLDAAVARAAGDPQAPEVLRRLVAEELSDPPKATAKRFVGSLPRTSAPEALYESVGGLLQRRRAPRPGRAWVASGSALLLVALVVGGWLLRREPPTAGKIQWVRVDTAKDLSPMSRALIAGLTGGVSELGELDGGR